MLTRRTNPKTLRKEWCLVSVHGRTKRVLKWFGKIRPSDEAVAKEEARIQYFANKNKQAE